MTKTAKKNARKTGRKSPKAAKGKTAIKAGVGLGKKAGQRKDASGRVYGAKLENDQLIKMIASARKAGNTSVYAVRKFIREAGFGINPHVLASWM